MILVSGATGNVGHNVVTQLLEAGEKVRAIARNPERLSFPPEVEVLRADLTEPESLPAALAGVERAFLFPVPGATEGFLAQGKDLRQVVLLSSISVDDEEENSIGLMHLAHERALAASGLKWTFVRPGGFMTNDLAWVPGVKAGVVRAPFGAAAQASVDERDIAAVVAQALLDEAHAGQIYRLSGPESLTVAQRVRIIGDVLGQEVRFEEQDPAEARRQMVTYMPEPIVDTLLSTFEGLVGTTAPVLPDVERVTGRPPFTYASWVAHHAADFR
ncbi:NAD(P)H-binding protein [Amycolatopsis sp.]|uniref:NAD(P)H-binding protein n=1 Tax=Amycolatopsis sp. TaxID=37632 RepID=UPI002D05C812|nr:NAD(P)H-binding protein [Amycolatopsis sp.]HVV10090.1 NAD(P)H-binding protein [Amycolatopsis sp.]